MASGASIASATAEAAAALLGLADAVELGLLNPEFGVAVGPLFSQAELRLTEAREQLELFRVSLSQGVGRELVEAGAFDIEAGGIFEPVEKD